MSKNTTNNEPVLETNHPYAIISGWLIIPAIATVLTFIGSIIMVTFRKPSQLEGFDLFIYYTDLLFVPFLIVVFYTWIKRKKILPILMIVFFLLNAAWNLVYLANGYNIDLLNLGMSIIWIIYFIKSKRVKATFTA